MAVLAGLLRKAYPFRKLWLAGTEAFALGILIPALLINQFFETTLILPGFLVGLFFSFLLHGGSGRGILPLLITLGFLLSQVLVYAVSNDKCWFIWVHERFGSHSVMMLIDLAQNRLIGVCTALGVSLTLRCLQHR